MGLIKTVFSIVGFLVLVVVGLGAYLYFTDYEMKATVTERSESASDPWIVVKPRLLPMLASKEALSADVWQFVCVGYEVKFRIQTHDYQVFSKDGGLIYDSKTGEKDTLGLVQCGATNVV